MWPRHWPRRCCHRHDHVTAKCPNRPTDPRAIPPFPHDPSRVRSFRKHAPSSRLANATFPKHRPPLFGIFLPAACCPRARRLCTRAHTNNNVPPALPPPPRAFPWPVWPLSRPPPRAPTRFKPSFTSFPRISRTQPRRVASAACTRLLRAQGSGSSRLRQAHQAHGQQTNARTRARPQPPTRQREWRTRTATSRARSSRTRTWPTTAGRTTAPR